MSSYLDLTLVLFAILHRRDVLLNLPYQLLK